MNESYSPDSAWAIHQLHSHISYGGWSFGIVSGLVLWMLMISIVL